MASIPPVDAPVENPAGWGQRVSALWRDNRTEGRALLAISAVFLMAYFMPVGTARFDVAVLEGIHLAHWYAREHVILCLLPAFLIAGAIAAYINQGAVMRFLGPAAPKPVALGVASLSGILLAVCSCTVLPLFGGIYRRGAGLGPAIAFLYSGPAINILAIVITAKVLGSELGIARAVGAIAFAVVIGMIMHLVYRREEAARANDGSSRAFRGADDGKSMNDTVAFFGLMVGILVIANWAPGEGGVWHFRWRRYKLATPTSGLPRAGVSRNKFCRCCWPVS